MVKAGIDAGHDSYPQNKLINDYNYARKYRYGVILVCEIVICEYILPLLDSRRLFGSSSGEMGGIR